MSRVQRMSRFVIVLVTACLLQACDMDLYSNLDEREANAMVAVLLRDGVPASRKVQDDGRITVVVDKDRFAQAMALLDAAGLPLQNFSNMGEVFKGNGLVSSPIQERAQMVYALSEELSHSVSQIDGISARVHVVLPDNDLLKRVISPSSASVLVRYDPGVDIDPLIPQIKTLVANGISGLSYDGVSVTAIKAAAVPGKGQGQAPLARFMGLWIVADNLAWAWLLFGGLLLAIAGLAGTLLWRLRQQRHAVALYPLKENP